MRALQGGERQSRDRSSPLSQILSDRQQAEHTV
jgi:hypothetical protein